MQAATPRPQDETSVGALLSEGFLLGRVTPCCWSAERVRVAFSLDCCDREAMAYVATTGAITGEPVRDLMAQTLEHRFGAGARQTPHPVEWLSDKRPPYTANETCELGRSGRGTAVSTNEALPPRSSKTSTKCGAVSRPARAAGETELGRAGDWDAFLPARKACTFERVHMFTAHLPTGHLALAITDEAESTLVGVLVCVPDTRPPRARAPWMGPSKL